MRLLLAVPSGFYLLELKTHPGRLRINGDSWMFDADRARTIQNPLSLTDLKSKELKACCSRPASASRSRFSRPRCSSLPPT